MTKKYELDLSYGKKPPWWKQGDPTKIKLIDGKHEYEFDVVMEDLPKDLVERMYDCLLSYKTNFEQEFYGDQMLSKPIGTSMDSINKHGSLIREIV